MIFSIGVGFDTKNSIRQSEKEMKTYYILYITCIFIISYYASINLSLVYFLKENTLKESPPVANRIHFEFQIHNQTIIDHYHWIKESKQQALKYVDEENYYTNARLSNTKKLSKKLAMELNNASNTFASQKYWEDGEYIYYMVYDQDKPFPMYKRMRLQLESCQIKSKLNVNDEIVLDYNRWIPNKDSSDAFTIGIFEVYDDYVAFSFDLTGKEEFQLFFQRISTQELVKLHRPVWTYYSGRWFKEKNSLMFYYNSVDKKFGIPRLISRICIENCNSNDILIPALIYKEQDISLTVELRLTIDFKYLFIKV